MNIIIWCSCLQSKILSLEPIISENEREEAGDQVTIHLSPGSGHSDIVNILFTKSRARLMTRETSLGNVLLKINDWSLDKT